MVVIRQPYVNYVKFFSGRVSVIYVFSGMAEGRLVWAYVCQETHRSHEVYSHRAHKGTG